MAKSLIPEIARMLGVELHEEFKIKGYDGLTYKFVDYGLQLSSQNDIGITAIPTNVALENLLNGNDEIIKLPWKPKVDETYYSFSYRQKDETWVVTGILWDNDVVDNALFKAGWIFKTEDEAREALPSIATEAGAKYEQ